MGRIFVVGHPSEYGGAGSELRHQIPIWRELGLEVTIIPTDEGWRGESLRQEMLDLGVTYEERVRCYEQVTSKDCVINFCGAHFLQDLKIINLQTRRTVFVNCMTWLFDKEKIAHKKGLISHSLYQRPQVLEDHRGKLKELGSKSEFIHFAPYFDARNFTFNPRKDNDRFTIGRISRQDQDKFAKETFHIWESAVAPTMKRGIVLGFNDKTKEKTGQPPGWVETYVDQNHFPVKKFYESCDIIVQSTDTTENWPRIGFEAMYSGCPLVVNNKGGWKFMLDHYKSGFLCDHERDFIYWTSRLAYEPELREGIAHNALDRAKSLSSKPVSLSSWALAFEKIFQS